MSLSSGANDRTGKSLPGERAFADGWCLVMAMWGEKFHAGYVNVLVRSVRRHSPECRNAILVTDRPRDGVDPFVRQVAIPKEFNKPEFFRPGYPVKLSVFAAPGIPPRTRCIFIDLDTLVVGDLTPLARAVRRHDDLLMLPPATVGFNALSRLVYRLTGGRRYRTGNSSVVAFSSEGGRRLAETFLALHADPKTRNDPRMAVDDRFISWFGQPALRGVPKSAAVMFRREFLSRVPFWPRVKSRLPWTIRRRAALGAITLNGVDYKPEVLLQLADGALIDDAKGRGGYWDANHFGPLLDRIKSLSSDIATGAGVPD